MAEEYYTSGINQYRHSLSGIKFKLERNSLGLLIGAFYLPTGIFAILSMTSFFINPKVVSKDRAVKQYFLVKKLFSFIKTTA